MHLASAHHHARKHHTSKYVPKSFLARFIDVAIFPIGLVSLLMTFPQAYEVWVNQNVSGVSLATWTTWTIISAFWILYGYVHKDRVIFFLNIGWIIMQALIAIGIYIHS